MYVLVSQHVGRLGIAQRVLNVVVAEFGSSRTRVAPPVRKRKTRSRTTGTSAHSDTLVSHRHGTGTLQIGGKSNRGAVDHVLEHGDSCPSR